MSTLHTRRDLWQLCVLQIYLWEQQTRAEQPIDVEDRRGGADHITAVQRLVTGKAAVHAPTLSVNGDLGCVQEAAGEDIRLVRVMPNTPCLVGETASAMCLGGKAGDEDAEEVRALFSSVGRIVQVPTLLFPDSR